MKFNCADTGTVRKLDEVVYDCFYSIKQKLSKYIWIEDC